MIITLAHQKGGVGKSTIALNIAILMEADFVIDLDIQKTLTQANFIRKSNGKKEINVKSFDNSKELMNFIEKNPNKLIIVDCGGFDSDLNRMLIAVSDFIITPVSNKGFELLGLKTFESVLVELEHVTNKNIQTNVLLNEINHNAKDLEELKNFIKKSKNFKLMNSIIRNRVTVSNSSSNGLSVAEFEPRSKSVEEFNNLIKEIKSIL